MGSKVQQSPRTNKGYLSIKNSWDILDPYRNTYIKGEWPTINEQFNLTTHLHPDKTCFSAYSPNEIHFKVDSVGKVFPLIDMKILDPDDNGIGEIAVKGSINCLGYYKNEQATKELFSEDGVLKTGDLGYLDMHNYLYLTGRKKSLVVTEGGKNVFPEEIEDYFQLVQEVEQVLIKGYISNKKTRSEAIEAVIYPSKDFYKDVSEVEIVKSIVNTVRNINKKTYCL